MASLSAPTPQLPPTLEYDAVRSNTANALEPGTKRRPVCSRRCAAKTCGYCTLLYAVVLAIAAWKLPSMFAQKKCVCAAVVDAFSKPCAPFPRHDLGRCDVPPIPGAFALGVADAAPPSETVCLVTGGTGGIGRATVEGLARTRRCRTLYLTGRSASSSAAVAATIARDAGHPSVIGMELNLADLSAVRQFAVELAARESKVGIAIFNAGTFGPGAGRITVDGFEQTFAISHLGHFLLFHLLTPLLRCAPHVQARGRGGAARGGAARGPWRRRPAGRHSATPPDASTARVLALPPAADLTLTLTLVCSRSHPPQGGPSPTRGLRLLVLSPRHQVHARPVGGGRR